MSEPDGNLVSLKMKVGERWPIPAEVGAVGAIAGKIERNGPRFGELLRFADGPYFKDEEHTGADRMMTIRLISRVAALAALVAREWPGLELRVTDAWDENSEHTASSTHYEGRAADLTVSDRDALKLGRLAALAIEAGFDWVFYENALHVHASVRHGGV